MNRVLVTGNDPLSCIRVYCKHHRLKYPGIINKLVVTHDTAHLADYAVKFAAISRDTLNRLLFIACFKKAEFGGLYLTSVRQLDVSDLSVLRQKNSTSLDV